MRTNLTIGLVGFTNLVKSVESSIYVNALVQRCEVYFHVLIIKYVVYLCRL